MITYVNTVLVSNLASGNLITAKNQLDPIANDTVSTHAGKFVIMTMDETPAKIGSGESATDDTSFPIITASNADKYETIRIGIVTKKNSVQIDPQTKAVKYAPIVKWSNIIKQGEIKSYTELAYYNDSEDTIVIDFNGLDANVLSNFAKGGKRIIVRLTFKDLPTRFRKWTESYEYVTVEGDTKATIASAIATLINKQYKRARVVATVSGTAVTLTAMKYTDDNTVDSLNWANKVRFNANIYFTDPAAEGWESKNKNYPKGVTITKTPGKTYPASAKLVRDRESQAMGYQGILNRGECTWPIIKPDMETDLSKNYDAITLEFERTYRAADDIFRKTKEAVEVYGITSSLSGLSAILKKFIG